MSTVELEQSALRHLRGEPDAWAIAPGRVNLIGEHTDTHEGFVLPAAISLRVGIAARIVDEVSTGISEQLGQSEPFRTSDLSIMPAGWARYPAAMAKVLSNRFGQPVPNLEWVVVSDVPVASGVSSSAALLVAFAAIWRSVLHLNLSNLDIARLAQEAERSVLGVSCGIMDPLASASGKRGHALFIDTRSAHVSPVPVPDDWKVVILDTRVPRELSNSAYNARGQECEEARQFLRVATLRDATLDALTAAQGQISDQSFRRARHVITENERVHEMVDAISHQDETEVRRLMSASHASLRDDYEVSCVELDTMVELALEQPGTIGARMTGAGFGGCCIALVRGGTVDEFTNEVFRGYTAACGREPAIHVVELESGVSSRSSSSTPTVL